MRKCVWNRVSYLRTPPRSDVYASTYTHAHICRSSVPDVMSRVNFINKAARQIQSYIFSEDPRPLPREGNSSTDPSVRGTHLPRRKRRIYYYYNAESPLPGEPLAWTKSRSGVLSSFAIGDRSRSAECRNQRRLAFLSAVYAEDPEAFSVRSRVIKRRDPSRGLISMVNIGDQLARRRNLALVNETPMKPP